VIQTRVTELEVIVVIITKGTGLQVLHLQIVQNIQEKNIQADLNQDTIKNLSVDTDPTVHQIIHRQDINVQAVPTGEMKVVQKENIVEKVHLLVMNQITLILHLKITNPKVLKH